MMEKEEIQKLAEIEYPIIDWADESTTFNREQHNKRIGFIKGYQKAQEWISVEDRLPDGNTNVIVMYGDKSIIVNSIGSGQFNTTFKRNDGVAFRIWDDNTIGVTHWQPLPTAP